MLDFVIAVPKQQKDGSIRIELQFQMPEREVSQDLMTKAGDFYAVWYEAAGLWSTDERVALYLMDKYEKDYAHECKEWYHKIVKEHSAELSDCPEELLPTVRMMCKVGYNGSEPKLILMTLKNADSGMIDKWHRYVKQQLRDYYKPLDEKLVFANDPVCKEDFASKRLDYPLMESDISAYDELMSVLYSDEERHKLEWAIGSIVAGDSKNIQKFIVLYGAAGTGKSTVLNIIQKLFKGHYAVFDAKALGSSNSAFALEPLKDNPLVAIQHDGDLSKIEDNTRLNSLVSHEKMSVNTKNKAIYSERFNCFLFMGTNRPVKITDAKSGILRRLIDVSPTGTKLSLTQYKKLMEEINFELGGIAWHCKKVYEDDPYYYNDYVPTNMMGASNDFYNFVVDSIDILGVPEGVSLATAWDRYKSYCDDARIMPVKKMIFKEELKNYFKSFDERSTAETGRVRNWYSGFTINKFKTVKSPPPKKDKSWIIFKEQESLLDKLCEDCPAQVANDKGTPPKRWANVKTTLKDISTKDLHYVKIPVNHIVVDFDIPDEDGNKSYEKNLEAASKWPKTYAELSKSGAGIHLHYIYLGDTSMLSRVFDEHIEIKVFTGNSSLRRKLSKCNDIPIATISSGLPLKGERQLVNFDTTVSNEKLRALIAKAIRKDIHPQGTKPNVDFIKKILDDAYQSGIEYDVQDTRPAVLAFAMGSTHQAQLCMKLVREMHFASETKSQSVENYADDRLVFYDVEVFPNLFLVNWKVQGSDVVHRMINPTADEIRELVKLKLVGFNCRRYDNHIMYARMIGYSNEQLYKLSQRIISGDRNAFFGDAYILSYTDVYDFSSKKQSLKKFEIELGIHHQELGIPWDQPVSEELWKKVAEYCDNDVIATEAVFVAREADWTARQILVKVSGMTVNDTTNSLTTKIIFGTEKHPQSQFCYRNLAEPVKELDPEVEKFLKENCPDMMKAWSTGDSKLPWFPGYSYDCGKSRYLDNDDIGEGGNVYAEPGMYTNVALLDIASMHPHTIISECLFGPRYTKRFVDIVNARIAIKHKDFKAAQTMLDGALAPFLDDETQAANLAQALKIAINSVYGLTAAAFENPFRDIRNVDNIVAKRGALFMENLKKEVQERGFTVAHIKTDSIKIPNATPEIIDFVMEYGRSFGYSFEHEATYEKMCLVNDAVYVAKYSKDECNGKHAGEWTATGTQFQVPYVFKTLFSKEQIEFSDMCETKSVTSSLYLDMNEDLKDGEHDYRFIGKVGLFCPIKPHCGGGLLLREKDGKYSSATGAKGYRWLEAEEVRLAGKEKDIDTSYYTKLVDAAVESISQYGDFEWFAE